MDLQSYWAMGHIGLAPLNCSCQILFRRPKLNLLLEAIKVYFFLIADSIKTKSTFKVVLSLLKSIEVLLKSTFFGKFQSR